MTANSRTTSDGQPAGNLRHPSSDSSGFASLAGRMSGWTTNLILTGVLLVTGLAFGRHDSGTSTSPVLGVVADGLGAPGREHRLQFGDWPWSLSRQSMVGPRKAIAEALRIKCGRLAESVDLPEDTPSPAEEDFLRLVGQHDPVEQEPGVWEVYELDGGFPMAAGIRCQSPASGVTGEGDLAASGRRVVTWGMAVPTDDESWTLYTYAFQSGRSGQPDAESGVGSAAVPLPPHSRRTLCVQVVGGGAIVAFGGSVRAESWKGFYDRWFARNGWAAAAGWRCLGSVWHARFTRTGGEPALSVDLRLAPHDHSGISGLLMISPPAIQATASEGS